MTDLPLVEIFTDGACKGNPGPGGWGAILRSSDGRERELSGGETPTMTMSCVSISLLVTVCKSPPSRGGA